MPTPTRPPVSLLPRWIVLGAVVLFVLAILLDSIARLSVDALWFKELGALQVWTTRLATQSWLGLVGFVVAFASLAVSIGAAYGRSNLPRLGPRGEILPGLPGSRRAVLVVTGVVALLFGAALSGRWLEVRMGLARVAVGSRDPIFGMDLGFYLFLLPLLRAVLGWAIGLAVVTGIGTAGTYLARGALVGPRGIQRRPLRHLGLLGFGLLLLIAVQSWLAQYDILYAPHGVIHGAGYADVHARLPAARLLALAAFAAAWLLLAGAWRARWRWILGAPALVAAVFVVAGVAWPGLLQKLVVEPNELVKEKPYIENGIRLTRAAYELEPIQTHPFALGTTLDAGTIAAHRDVVDNIRLWDWRPLLATYGQIQEIRLYYNFADVDIDRYVLDGRYRQVMISARELAYDQIPEGARTWVNLHLKYTHGYGFCMSPVNRITAEGLPELLVRDIPPVASVDLPIRRPEIYFGEQTSAFALVGTSTDEFDYPVGDANQSTRYAGRGGIAIGSLGRRLLFAWWLRSREMLLTSYLTPDTRLLMRRSLQTRAPRVAPFLRYDDDPYLVVDDGRLFWVQDAYTASDRYPYSQPVAGLNYIRNSVKVIVDAYDGTTRLYAMRTDDPLLQVYSKIFPGLFQPLQAMPPGLRAHLRYPEDLFQIQAEIYATYHMQDPQTFYNREDLWQRPVENVGGQERVVEPYYTITRLPDSDRPELILMLPFTPARKDNMIAWLAARCDGEHLGEREVFLFPKQALVYGPRQIEARIDQDPAISQQLTLWSQRGSNVIRGNLLVLPIGGTLLYVEPLYLQAEKGALPELKRVIMSHADRIAMGPDLESTLGQILAGGPSAAAQTPVPTAGGAAAALTPDAGGDAVTHALELLRQAEAAVQRGDWTGYGRAMQELKAYLESRAAEAPVGAAPQRR